MRDDKLENFTSSIAEKDITFCCIQETQLSRDDLFQIETSKNSRLAFCIVFHHGQPRLVGHGSGGVGILIGPLGKKT
eukprot:14047764-Ditylum_brightwellii.AAC.1